MDNSEHNEIRVLLLQELDSIANEVYQDTRADMDVRELTDLFALKITHRLKQAQSDANHSREGQRIVDEIEAELK
jgi:hypothetical protein